MPYRLSNNGLCVEQQKADGWQTLKCYDDKNDARAYLGALNANVEDAKAMEETEQADKMAWPQFKYTQEEVGYTDYAVRRNPVNSVCQTCRWFTKRWEGDDFMGHDCHIVEGIPLEIVGTGYCNEWTARKATEPEPMEVVIVNEVEEADDMEMGMMSRYDAVIAPPVDAVITKRSGLLQRDKVEPCFKVLSNGMWIAYFTNNIQDSDEEILKAKAHKDYVARAKAGLIEMPFLWRAHIEGTVHGKAKTLDYIEEDGVLTVFAIGDFYDTPAAKAAKRFYQKAKPGDISLSHGFMYPRWALKNGEYEVYNTFEISTLKRGQEANQWTSFSTKGKAMPLSEAQRKDLEQVYGEHAPEIIEQVERVGKANKAIAEGLNAKYKGYIDVTDTTGEQPPQDNSTAKALGALLPTLLEDSAAQMTLIDAIDKRLDETHNAATESAAQVKAVASFEARLKALETAFEMPATPASEAPSTIVDTTAVNGNMTMKQLEDMLGEMKAKQEIDAKKTGANNATVEALLFGGR